MQHVPMNDSQLTWTSLLIRPNSIDCFGWGEGPLVVLLYVRCTSCLGLFCTKLSSRPSSKSQTGKYVVRAEDLPRASKLPCAQRPLTRAEFEKYT